MASSYTPLLRLVLPVTGELTGTWGDVVNAGLTNLVEQSIAGTATITIPDANYTLTTANEAADEARRAVIVCTGTLTAQRNVVCPSSSKLYVVRNDTVGGFPINFTTAGGTGVIVPAGASRLVRCDGTNVLEAINGFSQGLNITGGLNVTGGINAIEGGTVTAGAFVGDGSGLTGLPTPPSADNIPLIVSATPTTGSVISVTASTTFNTGATAGDVFAVYNNSAGTILLLPGVGLTLRLAGSTLTGNRALLPRGLAVVYVISSTEYAVIGQGVQ